MMKAKQLLPDDQATGPPKLILVVDDDTSIRKLISNALLHFGYTVDAVEDGAAAWDALQLKHYDLMVTDNRMPKMSGVDVLKKIYAAHMTTKVIMATGVSPTAEFNRQPGIQPAAILIKPYTLDELVASVKEVLQGTNRPQLELLPPPTT